jgi:hypothetical protein
MRGRDHPREARVGGPPWPVVWFLVWVGRAAPLAGGRAARGRVFVVASLVAGGSELGRPLDVQLAASVGAEQVFGFPESPMEYPAHRKRPDARGGCRRRGWAGGWAYMPTVGLASAARDGSAPARPGLPLLGSLVVAWLGRPFNDQFLAGLAGASFGL